MSLDTSKFILQFQVLDLTTASGGGGGGITNHALLSNLDYASAGHTGFAATADFAAYLKKDGSVALTGPWNFGSQTISGTGDIHCNDLYTSGTSVNIGDNVVLSEYNNIDLQLNTDVYLAKSGGTTFYMPAGSDPMVFKVGGFGGDGDWRFQDSNSANQFRIGGEGAVTAYNWISFAGPYGITTFNDDINIRMNDIAGNYKVSFWDDSPAEVASINSNGDIASSGTIGWLNVQLSEYNNADLQINSDIRLTASNPVIYAPNVGNNGSLDIKLPTGNKNNQYFSIIDASDSNVFRVDADNSNVHMYGSLTWLDAAADGWIIAAPGTYDINVKMSENDGNSYWNWLDNSLNTVASVNSDGDADFHGNLTVSGYVGWDSVQISEYNNADFQINSNIRLTKANPLFYSTSGSDSFIFRVAANQKFEWQNSALGTTMTLNDAGAVSHYGDVNFIGGEYGIVAANANDLPIQMGDAAGVYKVSFEAWGGAEVAWIDSLGNASFTSTSGTGDIYCNDLNISGDINYLDTYWDDVRVPGLSVEGGTVSGAEFRPFGPDGSLYTYQFSGVDPQEVFFTVQLPHSYKEGTNIHPHVHYTPTTSSGSGTFNVRWRFEYAWADIGDVFPLPTSMPYTATVSGTAWQHQVYEFPEIDGTGKKISSMLACRLTRVATNGNDTYPDYISFLEFDFHFEVDSPGSRQEYIN